MVEVGVGVLTWVRHLGLDRVVPVAVETEQRRVAQPLTMEPQTLVVVAAVKEEQKMLA